MAESFDAAYYGRFYGRRPVHNRRQIAHLGEGVMSFASWWRVPIRSVLDVGAGNGPRSLVTRCQCIPDRVQQVRLSGSCGSRNDERVVV